MGWGLAAARKHNVAQLRPLTDEGKFGSIPLIPLGRPLRYRFSFSFFPSWVQKSPVLVLNDSASRRWLRREGVPAVRRRRGRRQKGLKSPSSIRI